MKHLKITHILNVSDMIPCFFEDSSKYTSIIIAESLKIEYLRINIGDYNDVQIKRAFPIVYRFIQDAYDENKDFFKNPSK